MHVFLSYAREDRERARIVASALEADGWSVWWDRKLTAGQAFDQTIEEKLEGAGAVVVLWSKNSIQSEWVRNEAGAANERGLLVPAALDDVSLPLEFRRLHTANLSGWTGDQSYAEYRNLMEGLTAKRDSKTSSGEVRRAPPVTVITPSPSGAKRSPFAPTFYAVGALALAAMVTAWLASQSGSDNATPNAASVPGRWHVSELAPTVGRSADTPAPLQTDTPMKMRMRPQEAAYLQLPDPIEELDLVVDLRLVDNVRSLLSASVSVFDPNGAVVQDALVRIGSTDYGRGLRRTASYRPTKPTSLGLKVQNGASVADIWVTARPARSAGLVPLFGEIVPKSIQLGESYKGQLGLNQEAYYQATLPIGAYDAVLEFARTAGETGQIWGDLIKSSSDGGASAGIIHFQDYGMSNRKSARFSVSEAGVVVFTMVNTADVIDYLFRVVPAGGNIP